MADNEDFLEEIAREEARLADLDRLREESRRRILALRGAQAKNDSSEAPLVLQLPCLPRARPQMSIAN